MHCDTYYVVQCFDAKEFPAGGGDDGHLKDWLVIRLELCTGGTLLSALRATVERCSFTPG